ncbi:MAG: ABC transporter substrate-binding protein [Candidatus Hydrogenedentes bacterium]|nr:ABC transporter substrate-binding protein [Candidatus Hydrogenedentota bacterium]
MKRRHFAAAALVLAAVLSGCGDGRRGPAAEPGVFTPVDPRNAVLWDRQITESGELLRRLVGEFNALHPGMPVKVEHAGGYADIFRKVSASIQAGVLPAMAVSYEPMTSEYVPTGAAVALDPHVQNPDTGFSQAELEDFYPAMLESNRFSGHGGRMYSFPLYKSVLMLYFNRKVLEAAGLDTPPATWEDFLAQCRRIRQKTGKPAHAVNVDCSTVNGLIYSMGGDVFRDGETLYDSPESVAVFELYETLLREGLAYATPPGSYDDNVALAKGEIVFTLRTSSARSDVRLMMREGIDHLGMARIPQKDPARPATVVYGPNVTIFNTTPEQIQTAWAFVKWFTTPEVSARWSAETGYLPVRRSALNQPVLQALWAEWDTAREPFDCLAFARGEPNIAGWQQVRDLVARALSEVLAGTKTGREAAAGLKRDADRALARAAGK